MDIKWRVSYGAGNWQYPAYPYIDRKQLFAFQLYNNDNGEPCFTICQEHGERLVYRCAVSQDFNNSGLQARIYSVGIYNDNGLIKVYNLLETGQTFQSDKWMRFVLQRNNEGNLQWVTVPGPEPELRPEEKIQ